MKWYKQDEVLSAYYRREKIRKPQCYYLIGKLDEKHREVIILRHFRAMSYDQISEALFCNKGTVTSRLYYARKRLQELLSTEKGGGTSGLR